MKFNYKNSSLILLLVIFAFLMSGCVCTRSKKDGIIKGAILGAAGGAVGGVAVADNDNDDDSDDDMAIGAAVGAVVGGIIGYFTDTCDSEEPVKTAMQAPIDTDSDGDGVVDRLDKCPRTPEGVKVDYNGCPEDSDNDGVYDYRDKCPGTPKGVKVDSRGCPPDSDGDGVYDYMDKCPDTPTGVKVDSKGCPPDSDGDGVYDYRDRCPETPKGARVNDLGCWVIQNVIFDFDRATIRPEYYPELDDVVKVLNNQPDLKIEIQGHTCNMGTEAYNLKLSKRRARAVLDYLVSKGIDSTRLSSEGYGESKPIASNDTEEGREVNRRAQLTPVM